MNDIIKNTKPSTCMKSFITLMFLACMPIIGHAQQPTDKQSRKACTEQAVAQALDARNYRIRVDYMNPLKGRSRPLTTSYSLTVRNDSLFSYLPYAGEAYNVPYGGGKALNFDAPISTYEMKEGKRGRKEIKITTTNEEDTYTYSLTVFSDGSTHIHVLPNRRQAISFNGQMETEE